MIEESQSKFKEFKDRAQKSRPERQPRPDEGPRRLGPGQISGLHPFVEKFSHLRCPSCKGGLTGIKVEEFPNQPTHVTCRCGDHGTVAYFTPAVVEPVERIIERTIHVEHGRNDEGFVKAISAAMALLVQAAGEEGERGLDLRWETLRLVAARDDDSGETTLVVVIKAWERQHQAPPSRQDNFGIVGMTRAEAMYSMGFVNPKPSSIIVGTSGT